ncbi:MAG TPA: energy transducer TonB [Anseongella sp.]|nr:energy transducer TonB [Anseongella sp.]
MAKIDLQDSRWCQIVFDGRNKEYGAYALRMQYSGHALRAIVIAILVFGLCAYAPILASIVGKKNSAATIIGDPLIILSSVNARQPEALPPPPPDVPAPAPAVKEMRFTAPEIVANSELDPNDIPPPAETIADDMLLGDKTRDGLSRFEVPVDAGDDGKGREALVGNVVDDNIYDIGIIQKKPKFPGGMDKILPYIMKNYRYLVRAKENNIEGTVFVQFTIDKDGSITDVRAVRGKELGGGLAEEAVRVVKAMPNWEPGEQNGRKVKVRYTLPVVARLKR